MFYRSGWLRCVVFKYVYRVLVLCLKGIQVREDCLCYLCFVLVILKWIMFIWCLTLGVYYIFFLYYTLLSSVQSIFQSYPPLPFFPSSLSSNNSSHLLSPDSSPTPAFHSIRVDGQLFLFIFFSGFRFEDLQDMLGCLSWWEV